MHCILHGLVSSHALYCGACSRCMARARRAQLANLKSGKFGLGHLQKTVYSERTCTASLMRCLGSHALRSGVRWKCMTWGQYAQGPDVSFGKIGSALLQTARRSQHKLHPAWAQQKYCTPRGVCLARRTVTRCAPWVHGKGTPCARGRRRFWIDRSSVFFPEN